MSGDTIIFSFNIPTQTKTKFQAICRARCLGMTSVLNSYIEKFVIENNSLNRNRFEHEIGNDFVGGIFPGNQDRWADYEV